MIAPKLFNHGRWVPRCAVFLAFIFLLMGLTGCASSPANLQNLNYPDDIKDPFLSLQQVIEGTNDIQGGFFRGVRRLIFGPATGFSLNQPTDMTVDANDRLLIVDSEGGLIYSYLKKEGVWYSDAHYRIPEIQHPTSIAASESKLYVSDLHSGNVFVLSYDFKILKVLDSPSLKRPGDLCFDVFSKRLFIADPGELIGQIGGATKGAGQLKSPVSVTSDPVTGNIFVLDGIARKVKIYTTELIHESSFGAYDQVPGSFAFPKGIALSNDGVIFVADASFGNIQLFDPSGALLYFFGKTGTQKGEFLLPRNLYIAADQTLFVADPYNNRVQIFQYYAQP
jgi:DNA-binding beta-propeller fold protein YncE